MNVKLNNRARADCRRAISDSASTRKASSLIKIPGRKSAQKGTEGHQGGAVLEDSKPSR